MFGQHSIFAIGIYSPQERGQHQIAKIDGKQNPFSPLKQFSDAIFLAWSDWWQIKGYNVEELRAMIQRHVTNPTTVDIVKRITEGGGNPPAWPCNVYQPNSREFAAVLATPNGQAEAWLLIQHRKALERKTIDHIRVWFDQGLYIMLYLADYTPSQEKRNVHFSEHDLSVKSVITAPKHSQRARL